MHKKVMLEFPDGTRRWGYATTEHSASSCGQPVITHAGVAHGPNDIGDIKIIVNDADVVQKLKGAGFNPISRASVKKPRGIAFPVDLDEVISREAERQGTTFAQVVIGALEEFYKLKRRAKEDIT